MNLEFYTTTVPSIIMLILFGVHLYLNITDVMLNRRISKLYKEFQNLTNIIIRENILISSDDFEKIMTISKKMDSYNLNNKDTIVKMKELIIEMEEIVSIYSSDLQIKIRQRNINDIIK